MGFVVLQRTVREAGPEPHVDQRRARTREQRRELGLRDVAGEPRIEDDRAHEPRVGEAGQARLADPRREGAERPLELLEDGVAGDLRRLRLAGGVEPLPLRPSRS